MVFLSKYIFIDMTSVFCTIIFATLLTVADALANCPTGCECDDNTLIVQCGEGQLDVLPIALNPSIQKLVIQSNKIRTIDSSIQFYAEVKFLDLSFNHISAIPQRTFIYQKKLQELNINNNKIAQINNKTFLGLSNLIVLNLRGNLISKLYEDTFSSINKLEVLNLGLNSIDYIYPKAFNGLTSLRVLYLDNNALTFIPDINIFKTVNTLNELYFGMNMLANIPENSFSPLERLKILNLKGTSLRNITKESFNGLISLSILDLSENRFSEIPTNALSQLKTLEELFLGENEFNIIPENAFHGMKNLKVLDICKTIYLKKIMAFAFATNSKLEYLNISSNKMFKELQIGSLYGLHNLRHIVFKANAFSTFPEEIFSFKNLVTLDLSENPLLCDCHIMWLQNLLNQNRLNTSFVDITCEFPERVRGKSLKNLSSVLMGCTNNYSRKQAIIATLLVGCVVIITALFLIAYRCRKSLRLYLKSNACETSSMEKKQHEYRKSFIDENYILQQQNQSFYNIESSSTYANAYTVQHNLENNLIYSKVNNFNSENQPESHMIRSSNSGLEKKNAIESSNKNVSRCTFAMEPRQRDVSDIFQINTANIVSSSILPNESSNILSNRHHTYVENNYKPQYFQSNVLQDCVDMTDSNYIYSTVQNSLSNEHFCPSISSHSLCNTFHNPTKHKVNSILSKKHINH